MAPRGYRDGLGSRRQAVINAGLRHPQPSGRAGVTLRCHLVNPTRQSGLKGNTEGRGRPGPSRGPRHAKPAVRRHRAEEVESDPDLPESRTVVQTAIYVKKKKKYVCTHTYVLENARTRTAAVRSRRSPGRETAGRGQILTVYSFKPFECCIVCVYYLFKHVQTHTRIMI